jgi:hypothetical protein
MFEQGWEWSGTNRAPFEPRCHILATISELYVEKCKHHRHGTRYRYMAQLTLGYSSSFTYAWIHSSSWFCLQRNTPYHRGHMHWQINLWIQLPKLQKIWYLAFKLLYALNTKFVYKNDNNLEYCLFHGPITSN